jgi:serine/threonine-protein kinase
VDKRTDIWAFGCCLFEMVTGRKAFDGDTATDTMAKIIGAEPEWSRIDGRAPARIRDLLAKCLTKDPRHRLHDIADARIDIEQALAEPVDRPAVSRLTWRTVAVASVLAAGVTGVAAWMLTRPPAASPAPAVRTVIPVRATGMPRSATAVLDVNSNGIGTSVAISPDGQTIAYVMRTDGIGRLYVRRLDQLEATAIEGSDGATLPLFSPDGQSVAFVRNSTFFRVALTGGAPTRIADIDNPRGVDWCADEVVFTRDVSSGLFKMSADGGSAARLTSLDLKRREKSHRFPHVLPGCRAVLFTIGTSTT